MMSFFNTDKFSFSEYISQSRLLRFASIFFELLSRYFPSLSLSRRRRRRRRRQLIEREI